VPGFDRVAEVYDATRSLRADVMAELVRAIAEFVGASSLLDVGVGTGRFAAPLAGVGVKVTGVDVSQRMIKHARDKEVPSLVISAAEAIPFRGESFDYALVVHFLHLVEDWRAAVKEIARVARAGMLSVVEDPSGSHPRDLYVRLREKRGYKMGGLKHGERELIERVKPSRMLELVRYVELFDPQELLTEYRSKLHSVTWDVPDAVNDEILDEMTPSLGKRREMTRIASIAVWDRGQLLAFYPST